MERTSCEGCKHFDEQRKCTLKISGTDSPAYVCWAGGRIHYDDSANEVSKPDNHDSHYRAAEAQGVEPIAVMEMIACAGLPEEYHNLIRANFNRAMAAKYLLRCGKKDAASQELDKAENYLHRARHGVWRAV